MVRTAEIISRLNSAYYRARQLGVLHKVPDTTKGLVKCILHWKRRNLRLCLRGARILRLLEDSLEILQGLTRDTLQKAMKMVVKVLSKKGEVSHRLYWKIKNGQMAQPVMVALYHDYAGGADAPPQP
jgi:hypothetical protein